MASRAFFNKMIINATTGAFYKGLFTGLILGIIIGVLGVLTYQRIFP
jgi:galactitol-specific phosphotransferase system IIC component